MKILARTEWGNPILSKKTKLVSRAFVRTPKFRRLVKDMIYTMRRTQGVGLAANQVGLPIRLAVMEMHPTATRPNLEHKGPIVIINPRILKYSGSKEEGWEGCLSCGSIRAKAVRSKEVEVVYRTADWEEVREKATGFWAKIFQHEIDHLNGITYAERVGDMKSFMTLGEFKRRVLKKRRVRK